MMATATLAPVLIPVLMCLYHAELKYDPRMKTWYGSAFEHLHLRGGRNVLLQPLVFMLQRWIMTIVVMVAVKHDP